MHEHHATKYRFKRSLTGLNLESSFSTDYHTNLRELSLPYYLPLAGRRRDGFIYFARVFVLRQMITDSSRI